jgi:hypothetical protein
MRSTEVAELIARVTRWAAGRADVVGLLLVGSVARGEARAGSDVDLVVLSTDPDGYADHAFAEALGFGEPIRIKAWGPVMERRFRTGSGLEVEFAFGTPEWAAVDPVDPGTHRVVTDGCRPLHDPADLLARLLLACRDTP